MTENREINICLSYLEDEEFVKLSNTTKGVYFQLYLLARKENNDGYIGFPTAMDFFWLMGCGSKEILEQIEILVISGLLIDYHLDFKILRYEEEQYPQDKLERCDKYKNAVIAGKEYLKKVIVFQELEQAESNWDVLKSMKTGNCKNCGKPAATHLHHLDFSLRPKEVISFRHRDFWVHKSVINKSPKEMVRFYLNYYGKENIEQTIKYYSVSIDEVIELCPSCHRKAHSKNNPVI